MLSASQFILPARPFRVPRSGTRSEFRSSYFKNTPPIFYQQNWSVYPVWKCYNCLVDIISLLQSKPVLIGIHLGSAIVGIDAFLWLLGKLKDNSGSQKSRIVTAGIGVIAFIASWIAGGYYYVVYYGTIVKPVIKSGVAPWVHNIVMETKEHIFLFIIPLSVTVFFITLLEKDDIDRLKIRNIVLWLSGGIAVLGLLIGAMGFAISAAARWGVIN